MGPRILVLCSSLGVGGAQRQLVSLVPRLRDRGFEPIVRTLRSRGGGHFFDDLIAAGISTEWAEMRSRWSARGAFRALRYGRLQPDVVFTQSIDAQVIGHLIARRAGVPHITTHHSGPGILQGSHRMFLTRRIAPHVERVIAVSGVQVPELAALGYRNDAVRMIPNGVDVVSPTVTREAMRADLGLDMHEYVALLVATLRPEKQVRVFIEGVGLAHKQNPAVRGVVAGGGPGLDEAHVLAAAGGGIVKVLGQRADIQELLASADVFCLTSDGEALPLSLIEAMSLRTPIVATNVGGIPDAVVDGQTGLLIPPGDPKVFAAALLELASDPVGAAALGEAGYQRFEQQFTVERMVDAYESVINEVLREHRVRPS